MADRLFWPVASALGVAGLALRLATMSGAPDNDDAFLFIRGVERFAVVEGRPHWHGYPVYMAVGKTAAFLVGDPVAGLQIVSAVAAAAIALPLAWIARAWAASLGACDRRAGWGGWTAALLWLVIPASWVTGTQIISDPLGLLFGAGVLALCIRGERSHAISPWIMAAVVAGLMVGVRLVNVTMLGPLVWKAWSSRRERWGSFRPAVALTGALLAGVVPWVAVLLLSDAKGFVMAGSAHLAGHFSKWGESVFTDAHPVLRPLAAFRTLAVYGLGAGTMDLGWLRALAGLGWIAVLAAAASRRPWRGGVARQVVLWGGPHLLYVFVAHDIDYPRYMLTAAALTSLCGGLIATAPRGLAIVGVSLTVLAVLPVSARLAVHQARQPPVEYQAARYLARHAPQAIVLSTQVDLIAIYLPDFGGGAVARLVAPNQLARWRRRWAAEGRRLYSTSVPPGDPEGWIPVARFCRDPMIEPLIAADLWLFASGGADTGGRLLRCGERR